MVDTNIDILVEKTNGLIETLDKYISGLSHQSINLVDAFTLFFAFLAVIVSGFSIYQTYSSDKKNRESTETLANQAQKEENERAKATIDANLTANARIDWIQNVRHATAELVTACFKYIGSESSELQKGWELIQEKKALFVLYFGPDDISSEKLASDLTDLETNSGKNNQIVAFVDEFCLKLNNYHTNHSQLVVHQKNIIDCNSCNIYDEETGECTIKYSCIKDEYGTLFDDNDCINRKNRLKKSFEECKVIEQEILSSLHKLSEIMRIYLKNEWKFAKKGK